MTKPHALRILLFLTAIAALALAIWHFTRPVADGAPDSAPQPGIVDPSADEFPSFDADELMPISEEEAEQRNALLPFSTEPVEAAAPLYLARYGFAETSLARAEECLATAVYYEAGFQTPREKRAVAQVVLNRVRHPAFPSSICEVVFQGSERRTGCQFTFTCDGSLRRPPRPAAWQSARAVASAALAGTVEPTVGMATHFHADYVLPYWARNLTKIEQVGRHIFYRWNGGWGRRSAFRFDPVMEDPGSAEILEALAETDAILAAGAAQPATVPSNILADDLGGLTSDPAAPVADAEEPSALRADQGTGTLREDEKAAIGP